MNLIWKIKPVLAGLMISGLFFSCAGEPETTDTAQDNMDDTVMVTDESQEESAVQETEIVEVFKVLKESYFLDDGSANGYKDYTYDEEGRLTGVANYRGSGELLFEEKYTLDEEGRTVKSELFDSEGLTSYTLFTYDDKSHLITEEYYNHRDEFLSGSRFEYDNRGRKILWESLDDTKTIVLKSDYIYKGSELIKVAFLTPLNKDDGSLDYFYEDDHIVKEISINGAGKEERRTEYEYEDDQVFQVKIFQLGRLSRVNEMNYDELGNKVEMLTYNRSKKLIGHTEYEYVSFLVEMSVSTQ
ncbi:MAG: hypothetical protein PQJ60_07955 [Spirochaetales bacterium]|nr:hypothetical protein [Spirochaetales bacterium]